MIFDPKALLTTLADHDVRYVLIGGLAATFHGSPVRTSDADICPARDAGNLARLSRALIDLDAKVFAAEAPSGLPFARDATFLARVDLLNLVTRFGPLDLAFHPSAISGYDELFSRAVVYDMAGVRVTVASLDDVIRSKVAADRPKDRNALPELEALRDEIRRQAKARKK